CSLRRTGGFSDACLGPLTASAPFISLSKSPEKPPPSFRFAVHHGAKRDADFNEPQTVMLGFFAQEPSRMSLEILLVSMPSRS
ncbi:hypothetical protein AMECASPLE_021516, partial [Ameca splendens]